MKKNKHLVEKVFLEINTNSMKVTHSLKNSINMFFKTELFALIEQELDQLLSDENQILQIEKLDISIDSIIFQNGSINTTELKEKIKNQLSQKLEQAKNQSNTTKIKDDGLGKTISLSEKRANTFIYYLINGVMPWWAVIDDTSTLNQNINLFINSETFKAQFQKILDKTIVQKRLINQYSNKQLTQIASTLTIPKTSCQDNKIINNLDQENNFQLKELFWTSVFKYIKDKNPNTIIDFYFKNIKKFEIWNLSFKEFIASLREFVPFHHNQINITTIKKEYFKTKKTEEDKPSTLEESDYKKTQNSEFENENPEQEKGYYIQNAGLIIIHPFIKDLFKNCNLIKEGNVLIDKELAAHILHYAATKKEQDYEQSMIFEKFLCGIPIQQTIQREINITDFHKEQIQEMLQSVLQHWSALKSTSIDLLRNEFLKREGKLDIQDNNPRIFVEKKTQDILLEKIPWNISVVKIPWIEKLIYTDW